MTAFSLICLLVLWSVLGFWWSTQSTTTSRRWMPAWLAYLLSGPFMIAIDLIWRWVDRPRPDRE
jgi:hypothetical protein